MTAKSDFEMIAVCLFGPFDAPRLGTKDLHTRRVGGDSRR